jgi:DNA repair exonuclease SbcCD ATPase subunit
MPQREVSPVLVSLIVAFLEQQNDVVSLVKECDLATREQENLRKEVQSKQKLLSHLTQQFQVELESIQDLDELIEKIKRDSSTSSWEAMYSERSRLIQVQIEKKVTEDKLMQLRTDVLEKMNQMVTLIDENQNLRQDVAMKDEIILKEREKFQQVVMALELKNEMPADDLAELVDHNEMTTPRASLHNAFVKVKHHSSDSLKSEAITSTEKQTAETLSEIKHQVGEHTKILLELCQISNVNQENLAKVHAQIEVIQKEPCYTQREMDSAADAVSIGGNIPDHDQCEHTIHELKEEVAKYQEKYQHLESLLEEQRQSISADTIEHEIDREKLTNEKNELLGTLNETNELLGDSHNKIDQLEKQVEEAKLQNQELKLTIEALQKNIKLTQHDAQSKQEMCEQSQLEIQKLHEQLILKSNQLQDNQDRIQELQSKLATLETMHECNENEKLQLIDERDHAIRHEKELIQSVEALHALIDQLHGQRESLEKDLSELRTVTESQHAGLTQELDRVQSLVEEYESLGVSVHTAAQKAHDKVQETEDLKQQNAKLEAEVKRLRHRLQDLDHQLKTWVAERETCYRVTTALRAQLNFWRARAEQKRSILPKFLST